MPVAYAVTYIWGTIGTGIILSMLGPKLLGVNMEVECKRYEKEMSVGAPAGGMQSAYRRLDMRAYKIGDRLPPGTTIGDAESRRPNDRLFVQRLRRDGKIIEFTPATVLQQGDVVGIAGKTEALVEVLGKFGNEVSDPELLDVPAEAVDVVLTNKAYDGKTLLELTKSEFARGVYLNEDHSRCYFRQHSDPGADQAEPRRHPATRGPESEHRRGRQESGLCRPPDQHDRHGLGGYRHRCRGSDRRLRHSGQRVFRSRCRPPAAR